MAKIMRIGDALYYKHEMSVQDTFVHKKNKKTKTAIHLKETVKVIQYKNLQNCLPQRPIVQVLVQLSDGECAYLDDHL